MAYEDYPDQAKRGHEAEVRYDLIRGTHIIRRATPDEDKYQGWDRLDDEFERVQVKARCSVRRGDEPKDMFPFELRNRDGITPGWAFKKGIQYIAYELPEGFLLVSRIALMDLVFEWGLALTRSGCVQISKLQLLNAGGRIVLDTNPPL
jgi:hypothetical protein